MNVTARERIQELTALLTVVSLALVIGAVRGVGPEPPEIGWLVPAVPHLNAAISVLAIGTILTGVRAIKRGKVFTHRRAILASTALFAGFLILYLYRVSIVDGIVSAHEWTITACESREGGARFEIRNVVVEGTQSPWS